MDEARRTAKGRRIRSVARERLLEEGTAFVVLEADAVRRLVEQRKEQKMIDSSNQESHGAPREAWDAIAHGYDSHVTPREAALATAALRCVGVNSGDRFLDVAAGTGGLAIPAARLGAKVTATDWSPKMIERFNARVRAEAIDDAVGRVMDCHHLDFEDDAFDVTGSQFGVMLVPEQSTALEEMTRVTRTGGKVLIVAYGDPAAFEALHFFIRGLAAVDPSFEGLPDDPPPLEFQLADPEVMRQRLLDAGLVDVRVDTSHQERLELRSGQQLWDWCLGSNPIPGMLVADLTDAQKASLRDELERMLRERSQGDGAVTLTAPVNIGIGTKP